jgi:hypothetical protein
MKYEVERSNRPMEIVEADAFEVKESSGGMFMASAVAVHYVFYKREESWRRNVAAFSDVRAIREHVDAPATQAEPTPETNVEVVN